MQHVDAVRAHYDGRAPRYDENPMHRGIAAEVAGLAAEVAGLAEEALGASASSPVALDVGTGTGLVLRSLPAHLRRIGVDLSPGMLAQAHAADPGLVLARADAVRLPLADASVDVVTCVTVLHLLPDAAAALTEWARVLRPGGAAITATFVAAGAPIHDPGFLRRHEDFRTADQVAALAARTGLRLTASHTSRHDRDTLLVCRLAR